MQKSLIEIVKGTRMPIDIHLGNINLKVIVWPKGFERYFLDKWRIYFWRIEITLIDWSK